jgi:hypothetical protein
MLRVWRQHANKSILLRSIECADLAEERTGPGDLRAICPPKSVPAPWGAPKSLRFPWHTHTHKTGNHLLPGYNTFKRQQAQHNAQDKASNKLGAHILVRHSY